MYVPTYFAENNLETVFSFMEDHSFALLVSDLAGTPFASHLPLLLDRTSGTHGTLVGHVARANPQWEHADGRSVLAIFSGPHAYVSPTWYESEGTVPTWNYAAVHAAGTFRVIHDESHVLRVIASTVETYERSMPRPWQFDSDSASVRQLLEGIVAFRIEIVRLEGKFKLGQNHTKERRQKVISGLTGTGCPSGAAVASMMQGTF